MLQLAVPHKRRRLDEQADALIDALELALQIRREILSQFVDHHGNALAVANLIRITQVAT